MKIKQKINLSFLLVAFFLVIPVAVSVFGFLKIKEYNLVIYKLDNFADLFYREALDIDRYSHILLANDLDDVERNEKLSMFEKEFLNNYADSGGLIKDLIEKSDVEEGRQILEKVSINHGLLKDSFENIKEIFVNIKTSQEKVSLGLSAISQKRETIKDAVFSENNKTATSTKDFFYEALSKYNEVKNLESSFLYDNPSKKSLDTLLFSISNLENYVKESSLFDDNPEIFLAFKDYREKLDAFYAESNYKNLDDYSIDLELRKIDGYTLSLFGDEKDDALLRLKEIEKEKNENILNLIAVMEVFFIFAISILIFFLSKKLSNEIISPLNKLRDFSFKIGKGEKRDPLKMESIDELSDLANAFNHMDSKLTESNKNLKQKVEELKAKENIESVVETLTDGIIMYDKNKKIVLKNSAVKKILNVDSQNLSLKNLYSIFAKHNLEFHINLSLKTDEVYRIDNVELFSKKYELAISGVVDYNNKIIGGLIIFHQKEKNEEYKHEDDSKIDFEPIISPHFGTPLSYIKLFTELLSSGEIGPMNKEQKECLNNIHQSAVNMKEVVDKLKDVTLLNNGALEINAEDINIVPFIKEIIKDFTSERGIKDVDFSFRELLPEDIKINIDKSILKKVIENILDNAVTYKNSKNPFVEVEIKELGFNYLLSVKDNGIGILEEEQDFIFDKFFRSKNAISINPKGSGISLYVIKKLLNKVGVEFFFESKSGEGSTFFIEIPKGGMRK